MAESYPSIVNQLKTILEQECRVQAAYAKVLADENRAMTPFDTEKVERLNLERSNLCEEMAALEEKRRLLVSGLSGGTDMKLSDAIDQYCTSRDKQVLFPIVRRLKVLVHQSRNDTRDFNDLNSFSLGLVNSIISLVSSGKQGITRFYSGRGILKESYHPSGSRLNSVLKEA